VGSPNPLLTSIALTRRLADHLVPIAPEPDEPPRNLFNGVDLRGCGMVRPGRFVVVDGTLQALPGADIGLLWSTTPAPPDFVLRCEWRCSDAGDNSAVFVRFPRVRDRGYDNPAYVAVHLGFEVQIDEVGFPDGLPEHRTGAVYGEPDQASQLRDALPLGRWNTFEIRVQGQTYAVSLNAEPVTRFENRHAGRGEPTKPNAPSFVGLQAHTGTVAFRNLLLEAL
jgi:3-keto-disaccharide hydrolase